MGAVAGLVMGVALAGCSGDEGPQCEVDPDCPAGQSCNVKAGLCEAPGPTGGACQVAGNLVRNGSFECGVDGWVRSLTRPELSIVESGAKEGAKALRVTSPGTSSFYASSEEFLMQPGTVCARGWLRGSTKNGHFRIGWNPTDGTQGRMESFSQPMSQTEWAQVQPSRPFSFVLPKEAKLHVRIAAEGESSGTWLEADGVRVWHSADGSCREP